MVGAECAKPNACGDSGKTANLLDVTITWVDETRSPDFKTPSGWGSSLIY